MTSPSQTFTSAERAVAISEITHNPGIGISALAKKIRRSKAAAKALREEVRPEIPPHDLLQSRVGELDFSLDRLFPHPFNTRIIDPGAADIVALAAQIERNGQLEPLTVIRDRGNQSDALVIDGVRRLTALRWLKRTTAKVVFVQLTPIEIAAIIQARDRTQRRLSAYEFALHIDAIVGGYQSELDCAASMGMKADAFSKARAPTQLPDCVMDRISEVRAITGKGAAAVRARWNRAPHTVLEALSAIPAKAPARQVFAAICDDIQHQSGQSAVLTVPRVDLERLIAAVGKSGETIPTALLEFLDGLLGQRT